MLDNIGRNDADLAKFLDISPRTLGSYRSKGQAPRVVMLALFWESTWGQSAANCDAVNWGRLQFQENAMLKRQIAKLAPCLGRQRATRTRPALMRAPRRDSFDASTSGSD
jgi:hypothetical protein